jgi:hypothetical protein
VADRGELLSEAVLIAGVPLLGYAIAFAYEYGYGQYYGIPRAIISLTLSQVLLAVGTLVWLLFIWFSAYFGIFLFLAPSPRWLQHPAVLFFRRLIPLTFLLVVNILIFRRYWHLWVPYLALFILFGILFYIVPILGGKGKTYNEKMVGLDTYLNGLTTPLSIAAKKYGRDSVTLGIWIFLIVSTAFGAGLGEALNQEEYFVDSSQTNVVILRFYGDTIVGHEYDPDQKKLIGNLIVTKVSPTKELRFNKKFLGHLEKPAP